MAYKNHYDMNRPWKDVMEEMADDDKHEEFYNSHNPLVSYLHNKRIQIIRDLIKTEQVESLFEVGCGDGFFLKELSNMGLQLTGVEISEKRIERAQKLVPEANIIQGDARSLEIDTASFDLVVCTEVLEHIPEPKLAIDQMKRIVKKNGLVIVTVPNEWNWRIGRAVLLRFPIRIPDHINSFNVSGMSKLFESVPENIYFLPPFTRFFCLTNIFVFRIN